MSDLTPITREEQAWNGDDLTPITRKEMYIRHLYDETQVIPEPITREEMFIKKAAEAGGGGGGGGFEELTQAQYDALPDEDKMDSEKAYYVPNSTHMSVDIKRVSEVSSKITSSTYNSDATAPWKAFNGISPSSYTSITNCWIATSADETPWICYEFDNGTLVDNVTVKFATYRAYTGDKYVKVQGSNDKDTWVDLATTELDITTEFGATTIEIPITNNTTAYRYWRLFFPQKINGSPSTTLYIDEIYMDGVVNIESTDIIYHEKEAYIDSDASGSFVITKHGDIEHGYPVYQKFVDTMYKAIVQAAMTVNFQNDGAHVIYKGGNDIGCCISNKINLKDSNIIKIRYTIETTTHYDSQNPSFDIYVGVKTTYQDYTLNFLKVNQYDYTHTNTTINGEIDISDIEGDCYFNMICSGWNLDLTRLDFIYDWD